MILNETQRASLAERRICPSRRARIGAGLRCARETKMLRHFYRFHSVLGRPPLSGENEALGSPASPQLGRAPPIGLRSGRSSKNWPKHGCVGMIRRCCFRSWSRTRLLVNCSGTADDGNWLTGTHAGTREGSAFRTGSPAAPNQPFTDTSNRPTPDLHSHNAPLEMTGQEVELTSLVGEEPSDAISPHCRR